MLRRFAEAGVAGLLFEHLGEGSDPDEFRASGNLGTVPPPESGAGGTAADLRDRLAAYSASPLAWPEGSPCFSDRPEADASDQPDEVLPPDVEVSADTDYGGGTDAPGDAADQEESAGCGCAIVK